MMYISILAITLALAQPGPNLAADDAQLPVGLDSSEVGENAFGGRCPRDQPLDGDWCFHFGPSCKYGWEWCGGKKSATAKARCHGFRWEVKYTDPCSNPGRSCPRHAPKPDDKCIFHTDGQECLYGREFCRGAYHTTKRATCRSGTWKVVHKGPCEGRECPRHTPKSGDDCSDYKEYKTCTSGKKWCCGKFYPRDTATCEEGKWSVVSTDVCVCAGATEGGRRLPSPESMVEERRRTGDTTWWQCPNGDLIKSQYLCDCACDCRDCGDETRLICGAPMWERCPGYPGIGRRLDAQL